MNWRPSQLNADLRQVRKERGEMGSADVRFETKHGAADFAVGDRVQFTDTDKRQHIYNGNAGGDHHDRRPQRVGDGTAGCRGRGSRSRGDVVGG
jgi:ATP-dependent exoDNAse (exonuclease V) alpha subunit